MANENREQKAMYLPVDVVRELEEADEYQWKLVAEAIRAHRGIGDACMEDAYRRRIEELDQERQTLEAEIEERQDRLEKVEHDLDREREQLDQYLAERADYEERLDEVLEAMASETGTTVHAHTSDLREVAREYHGRDTVEHREQVVADLRERVRERDLDVADHRLSLSKQAHQDVMTAADGGEDVPDGIAKFDADADAGGDD